MTLYIIIGVVALLLGGLIVFLIMRGKQSGLDAQLSMAKEQLAKAEENIRRQAEEIRSLTAQLATAEADKQNLQEKLEKQLKEAEEMQKRLTAEFENIASKVLQQRQEEFSIQSRKQIGDILLPLNEKIKDFRDLVTNSFSQETREKASLQEQLRQLLELNKTLSEDANNLTKALKGDVKKQGNWGEFVLEKVLEASGLRKGIEYDREVVVHGTEGEILRPDVIIRMPDNKQIIVDSKVSLVAYEQMQEADTEERYAALLKAHIESLRQHVKELYDKQYQQANGLNTPDFVLMFVPIEASYTAALQADNGLYDYALEKKIVIVSPTTLLATLHTVAYVWKQENQSKNAMEIARLAGAMYDKLCGSLEDLQKIQKALDAAQKAYNESIKKLSEGNGNVLRTAEKIKELGAKTSKSLPADVIEE